MKTNIEKLQSKVENYLKANYQSYICDAQIIDLNNAYFIEIYTGYKKDNSPSIQLTVVYFYGGLVKIYSEIGFINVY